MKVSCERCSGKGSLYTAIAGDVHIANCPDCEGYGVIELKAQERKVRANASYGSFGAVDLDSILGE